MNGLWVQFPSRRQVPPWPVVVGVGTGGLFCRLSGSMGKIVWGTDRGRLEADRSWRESLDWGTLRWYCMYDVSSRRHWRLIRTTPETHQHVWLLSGFSI